MRIQKNTADLKATETVDNPVQFCRWVNERTGTPYPSGKGIAIVTKVLRDFFQKNPKASYSTLTKTVEWCCAHKKRLAYPQNVVGWVPRAYADGWLPELERDADSELDAAIKEAAAAETDPTWSRRLNLAYTIAAKSSTYAAWKHWRATGEDTLFSDS